MAKKDKNQEIVKKMEAAYADFSRYMEQLSVQATALVKKHLKKVDSEKIGDVLKKIKSITKK